MSHRKRVGILISGRGSNMSSLITACESDDYPAVISLVISNRPDAPGLKAARNSGIPTATVDHKSFPDRKTFETALHAELLRANVELLCNAGFMRLLTAGFVARWLDRQLNIHPSLLPAYKGLNTHARVLEDGARITGCTVHFVRAEMDAGPIVAQAAVPVQANDTSDSLAARVLEAEHQLYPAALRHVASGHVRVVDDRVVHAPDASTGSALYSPDIITV